jgi:hypothetical protein
MPPRGPTAPRPYFRNDWLTAFHGDAREILPRLVASGALDPREIALAHNDPPYGVDEETRRASRGRGMERSDSNLLHGGNLQGRDWSPIAGDD